MCKRLVCILLLVVFSLTSCVGTTYQGSADVDDHRCGPVCTCALLIPWLLISLSYILYIGGHHHSHYVPYRHPGPYRYHPRR